MSEKSSQGSEFVLPVRVYIEDTDAGGIVYYVNYLKFMERARTEYMRSLGYQHYALAQINYRKPGRIDDDLRVSARLVALKRATLVFAQRVTRDQEVLCEATIKVACVSADGIKPVALPGPLHDKFKAEFEELG